ncbi:nose resistant to fluoxetine protein 6-like [Amphibalanus amphitrite]|uniref:nose resistant to fluoxetine protein 6-like n=1 Tax=Amphibalanus amphitrite TaxID=1232801 RepID=UPI001C9199D3|nr:nose resistant to fluoxetine protein 6-like [Amphibalanus amphitrite]
MVRYYELTSRDEPPAMEAPPADGSPPLSGRLRRLLTAFSLRRNAAKILDTRTVPGDIGCMYGIRALSVMWITLLHSDNMASVEHPFMMTLSELRWWPLTILGPTLVPDTFLLLSATLVSYNHFRGVARAGAGAPRGAGFWVKRLVKRYWRLTPPHMAVVWVLAVGLSWHYGSSPFWPTDRRAGLEPGCDPFWWRNLLLVHNLFPHAEMCIDQTWYLAVEWQLFLVTPPLLVLLERSVTAGTLLLTALMASAAGLNLALAIWYDFVGEMLAVLQSGIPANNQAFRDVTYDKPYIRSVGYLLGLLLGRLLCHLQHEAAPDSRLRRVSDALSARRGLAAASTAIALLLMALGMGLLPTTGLVPRALVFVHIGVARSLWCLGVAWIILSGARGFGGVVDRFLSWGFFKPLGRLTYCMYLLHPLLLAMFWSNLETQSYPSASLMVAVVIAASVVSFGAAFLWSLLFEMPHLELMRMLVDGKW